MGATISMFWSGPLSAMERLSMASFVANGHPVDLYSYGELAALPDGVRLRDAADILPASECFVSPRAEGLWVVWTVF
jgi:hypothetical protein